MGKKLGKKAMTEIERLGEITDIENLPSDAFLRTLIKLAMTYNEPGAAKTKAKAKKSPPKAPAYLLRALRANRDALQTFQKFSPTHQREYIAWITSAKTEETRERRLETAVDWMSEGKSLHWKYQK